MGFIDHVGVELSPSAQTQQKIEAEAELQIEQYTKLIHEQKKKIRKEKKAQSTSTQRELTDKNKASHLQLSLLE